MESSFSLIIYKFSINMEGVVSILKSLEAVARGRHVDELNLLENTKTVYSWATSLNFSEGNSFSTYKFK